MSNGRPLDDAAVYTVVLNDFMADGGDRFGFMGRDIRTESVGIADLDALIEYARTQSQPIRAPVAKRLIPVTR
jgi:2',3'-cyclic-nucleotide 2'-phosphodiesterase (5'-nucleotidase family)